MNFETVSSSDLDWILKWNCRFGLGFEKPKSVHLCIEVGALAYRKQRWVKGVLASLPAFRRQTDEGTSRSWGQICRSFGKFVPFLIWENTQEKCRCDKFFTKCLTGDIIPWATALYSKDMILGAFAIATCRTKKELVCLFSSMHEHLVISENDKTEQARKDNHLQVFMGF